MRKLISHGGRSKAWRCLSSRQWWLIAGGVVVSLTAVTITALKRPSGSPGSPGFSLTNLDDTRPYVQVKNTWMRGRQEPVTRSCFVWHSDAGAWGNWIIGKHISKEFADRFPEDDFVVAEGVIRDIRLATSVHYTNKVEITYSIEVFIKDARVVETGTFD